jgi:hypothetical protein
MILQGPTFPSIPKPTIKNDLNKGTNVQYVITSRYGSVPKDCFFVIKVGPCCSVSDSNVSVYPAPSELQWLRHGLRADKVGTGFDSRLAPLRTAKKATERVLTIILQ